MRHLVFFAVFVAACVGGAVAFDVDDDSRYGYVLLCVFFLFPLATALWAYATSRFDDGREAPLDEAFAARRAAFEEAYASALPPGVSWVHPEHQPGACRGPETPLDEAVED